MPVPSLIIPFRSEQLLPTLPLWTDSLTSNPTCSLIHSMESGITLGHYEILSAIGKGVMTFTFVR